MPPILDYQTDPNNLNQYTLTGYQAQQQPSNLFGIPLTQPGATAPATSSSPSPVSQPTAAPKLQEASWYKPVTPTDTSSYATPARYDPLGFGENPWMDDATFVNSYEGTSAPYTGIAQQHFSTEDAAKRLASIFGTTYYDNSPKVGPYGWSPQYTLADGTNVGLLLRQLQIAPEQVVYERAHAGMYIPQELLNLPTIDQATLREAYANPYGGNNATGASNSNSGVGVNSGGSTPLFNTPTGGGANGGSGSATTGSNSSMNWGPFNPNDLNYLRDIITNKGYSADQAPAWQAMIEAQQRNLNSNYASMMEGFNASGNYESSPFAQAAVDYWGQAGKDQNALLANMVLQAQEAGRNRQYGAANSLAGITSGWLGQQSSQDFQDYLTQLQQSYGSSMAMYQGGLDMSKLMAQLSAQGAQGMFNAENQGAMSEAQRQIIMQQLGLSTAGQFSSDWLQNLLGGNQIGMGQYATMQDSINRMYQEWMRTQAPYNPLLGMMYGGATSYTPMYYPQYQPSIWPQLLGGMGGIMGSLPGFLQLLGIGGNN